MGRDANGALGQRHVPGHADTLQERGSDVAKSQDESVNPSDPLQPSRYSSISPTEGIKSQDGQELTTSGQASSMGATRRSGQRGSCCEVLSCSPSPARVAEVDLPEMPPMVAFDDD